MLRVSLTITALFLFVSSLSAQEPASIPASVQKHMASMVGSWTFKGKAGDGKFSGEETIRLSSNKTALIQEGYFAAKRPGGKKEHYVILSGWDGGKKTVLVRGFTSDGITWTGEWKKVKNGKWVGTASGAPAKFEVKKDSMRYEDASSGKPGEPWISEFTRKKEMTNKEGKAK